MQTNFITKNKKCRIKSLHDNICHTIAWHLGSVAQI